MLRTSRYLHLVPLDGKVAAVNTLSGGVAFVASELAVALTRAHSAELEDVARRFPELEGMGAFVSVDLDERDLVRVRIGQTRFADRSLNLTIVPTLACNMRCCYCDQQEESRRYTMSGETAEALLRYVAARLDDRKLLCVTWYGGEPFLAYELLVSLQCGLFNLCAERGLPMVCNITTNGTLVSRERIAALRDIGIRQVQITLDGPARIHDRRRTMEDGSGTFQQTLDAILGARDLVDVRVRVNVDGTNAHHLPELLSLLADYGLVENTYIAPVVSYGVPCAQTNSAVLAGPDFAKALMHVMNFMTAEDLENHLTPSELPCTALSASTFVFGPRGHVYRCWHDLDYPERAIDHVVSGEGVPSRRLFWLTYDPLANPTCAECSVLPLCLGGCPERRRSGISPPDCCSPLRTHLPAFLKRYAELVDRDAAPAEPR